MNCKHCGYPVNRGQKLCPSCGKPVKRGKGLRIFLAVLLILVLAVVAGLHYRAIGNLVTRRSSDPVEYYRYVELQHADDLCRLAGLFAGKSDASAAPTPQHSQIDLQLQLGEKAQQFLGELNTGAIKLGWIRDLGLSADLRRDRLTAAAVDVVLNETSLFTLDATVDTENAEAALLIPELSEQPFRLSLAALSAQEDEGDVSISLPALLGSLPAQKELKAMLRSYVSLAVNEVTDVTLGSETLKAGELSVDYTTLTVRIDPETAQSIALKLGSALRDDAQFKQIVVDASGEEAYASFQKELDGALSSLKETPPFDGDLVMVLYVNQGGTLFGRLVRLEGKDDAQSASLLLALPVKGTRFGLLLSREDQSGKAELSGDASLHGKALSGRFTLSRDGEQYATADVEARLERILKGLAGEVSALIRPQAALLQSLELPVEAESFGQELALEAHGDNLTQGLLSCTADLFQSSERLVRFALSMRSLEPGETPVMPEALDLADWTAGIKMPGLLGSGSFGTIFDNLKQAGMPGELITGLKLLLPSLLK